MVHALSLVLCFFTSLMGIGPKGQGGRSELFRRAQSKGECPGVRTTLLRFFVDESEPSVEAPRLREEADSEDEGLPGVSVDGCRAGSCRVAPLAPPTPGGAVRRLVEGGGIRVAEERGVDVEALFML